MDPFSIAMLATKVTGFFKKLVTSPWFYAALIFLAIGGGTYFYLKHDKKQDIAAAVEQHSSKATIQTYKAKDAVSRRTEQIDEQFDARAAQTTKEYAHVREQIQTAPPAERDAQAPAILIDTLNRLDGMHQDGDGVPVPDSEVPVG